MILEGIVTTLSAASDVNVAPMGAIVDRSMTTLRLRPFQTSETYQNLKAQLAGVFHVVDDVLLLARSAIGRLTEPPEMFPAETISGVVLKSACRWYEFQICTIDDSQQRANILARVAHAGRIRDFFGFNRAKHAVLEAAILATRIDLLPRDDILNQLATLRIPVEKTGDPREAEAFELIECYVAEYSSGK